MKKRLFFIFIAILIVLSPFPLANAIEFNLKSNYSQHEVILAKLSGQFYNPPLKEDIYFYRGHVRVGIDHDIAKIGENYYLFVPLGSKDPRNYSVSIENVEYRDEGEVKDEDITRNFTITDNIADFSISKGFISTDSDFKITVDNSQDKKIDLSISHKTIEGEDKGISYIETHSLSPGEKQIEFDVRPEELASATVKELTLSSENQNYTIPVSIFVDEQTTKDVISSMDIAPKDMEIKIPTNSNITKLIYIYNTGTGTLKDVKLTLGDSLRPYVELSEDEFGQILPENNANLEMSVVSGGEQSLAGTIKIITSNGLSDELKVSLDFVPDYNPPQKEQQQDIKTTKTCEEIGGTICKEEEECDGDNIFAKNQFCCVGKCTKDASSSVGKLIGWGIFVIIIVVGLWFFLKKYKKIKSNPDLLKKFKPKKESKDKN